MQEEEEEVDDEEEQAQNHTNPLLKSFTCKENSNLSLQAQEKLVRMRGK